MADPPSSSSEDPSDEGRDAADSADVVTDDETDAAAEAAAPDDEAADLTEAELRERVEEKYDFDDFGPRQMDEMTVDEWEAVFDSDSWITGDELLDRVATDLRAQIASRNVFAILEEVEEDGQRRLLAYSDEGYALVYPDGSVRGFGTVLRDVKPVVALCSMDSYTPAEPPEGDVSLPDPEEVPEGTGEFGHLMIQVVAGAQLLAGLVLIGGWIAFGLSVIALAAGIFFLLIALFLFATVANARLSDRFRAEEYRDRLRAVGVDSGEYPEFVPVENGRVVEIADRETADREPAAPVEDGSTED